MSDDANKTEEGKEKKEEEETKAEEVVEETKEEAPAEEPKEEKVEEKKEEPKKEEKKEEKKEKKDVKLSKDAEKVLDMVKKMSLMEVADLVTALEDEFGVSAAAPMAMAAAPAAGGDAGGAEEKDAYDVELTSAGSQKIAVIKVVKELAGLGLKEAKDIVDAAPKVFMEGAKTADAEEAKKKLEEAGATCTLK